MTNEQHGQLAEQLKQIHTRLDHIEKNLILQQPDVVEFTKTVYPHLEAVTKRCATVEQKMQALEELARQYQAHMAENWATTDGVIEQQKEDFTAISQRFQGMATKELQGTLQSIRAELAKVLAAEKKCDEALAECRSLAQQVGQTYETASGSIQELAETATKHVNEVKESSTKAIEQARTKFVKTFRRLDSTLWDHPFLGLVMLLSLTVGISAMSVWTLNKLTTDRVIDQAVEASTTATQEALKPFREKIGPQTQSLDVIYQQSEAFERYLRSLPANQRDKKRAELIEGVKSQKQPAAEDARRQAE
jgi:hypothetical protein